MKSLGLLLALVFPAAPAFAWHSFQTAESLNRFGWEFGLGADLSVSGTKPSASIGLSDDLWMRFRSSQYTDAGFWIHAPDNPFAGGTLKAQWVHSERARVAGDFGIGAGYESKSVFGLGRGGILLSWRFAKHLAMTFGGHLLARLIFVDQKLSAGVSLPLFFGFEFGGEHLSLRPEVEFTPPSAEVARSIRLAFGLSFR